MANPYVATIITVVIGIILGMTGYSIIWPLFGAANQLLAALALLAVCAWLGNAGRNNKMFFVPMAFMLLATLTSLAITFYQKVTTIMTSGIALAPVLQAILAVLLFVLAIVLAVKGVKTIGRHCEEAEGILRRVAWRPIVLSAKRRAPQRRRVSSFCRGRELVFCPGDGRLWDGSSSAFC